MKVKPVRDWIFEVDTNINVLQFKATYVYNVM